MRRFMHNHQSVDVTDVGDGNGEGMEVGGHPIVMRPRRIQCINCGMLGHTAKKCNEPVTSYGIILTRTNPRGQFEYLMIQRKDSLSFVEFIRGKYDVYNKDYILRLFSNMTSLEKLTIVSKCFETIWAELWMNDLPQSKRFIMNFHESKRKFDLIKKGFYMKDDTGVFFFNFEYILNHCAHVYEETEWEFPKGRRHMNEPDMDCACREFEEETGMHRTDIAFVYHIKPIEEVFVGMNRIRYRHVFYVAKLGNERASFVLNRANPKQACEVRNAKWCTLEEVLTKTRELNVERKQLIQRVHYMLQKPPSPFVVKPL